MNQKRCDGVKFYKILYFIGQRLPGFALSHNENAFQKVKIYDMKI